MSVLYVEINGEPVQVSDAVWVRYAPCGCMSGVSNVDHGGGDLLLTEDAAYLSSTNTETKREANLDRAAGFTMLLAKFSDYRSGALGSLTIDCPHTPRFGIVKTPIPDGYAWGYIPYRRAIKVRHLALVESLDNWKEPGTPLCGTSTRRAVFQADDRMRHQTYECTRCVAAAKALASDAEQVAS